VKTNNPARVHHSAKDFEEFSEMVTQFHEQRWQ
jgi:hypothetical protein